MKEMGMGGILSIFHSIFHLSQTPLHMATWRGSVECVNALIQHGADMAGKDVRKESV